MTFRTDYLGVHAGTYARIAAGERDGWTPPAVAARALAGLTRAFAHPAVPRGGRMLELGCGDGVLSAALLQWPGWRLSGIDIVPQAIELAQARAARLGCAAEFVCGSVLALPWADASFDAVVDSFLLHCIVLGDRALALQECLRVLRPGGAFVVMTMVGDPPPEMLADFDPQTRCMVRGDVAGRHFGTRDSILAELGAAGFSVAAEWLEPADAPDENDGLLAVALKPAQGL